MKIIKLVIITMFVTCESSIAVGHNCENNLKWKKERKKKTTHLSSLNYYHKRQ